MSISKKDPTTKENGLGIISSPLRICSSRSLPRFPYFSFIVILRVANYAGISSALHILYFISISMITADNDMGVDRIKNHAASEPRAGAIPAVIGLSQRENP